MQDNRVEKTKVDEAYERWNKYFGRNEFYTFWRFLETRPYYAYARDDRWDCIYLSPTAIRKLEMLLGPNHIAIIKAYRARTLPEKKSK